MTKYEIKFPEEEHYNEIKKSIDSVLKKLTHL
jgi:hypothetical protein